MIKLNEFFRKHKLITAVAGLLVITITATLFLTAGMSVVAFQADKPNPALPDDMSPEGPAAYDVEPDLASSDHTPLTEAALLTDDQTLYELSGSKDPLDLKEGNLLEKYQLELEVHAENIYHPDNNFSFFSVEVASTTDRDLPDISVSARITRAQKTKDIPLYAEEARYNYLTGLWNKKSFRARSADLIGLKNYDNPSVMVFEDSEKLVTVVTIVIGNEKQTLTFYPTVEWSVFQLPPPVGNLPDGIDV